MRKSIKIQIAVSFIGLITAILLSSLLANKQFLEKYYIYHKQSALLNVYEEMQEIVNSRDSERNMLEALDEMVEVNNIMFVLVSEDGTQVISSASNERQREEMVAQLFGHIMHLHSDESDVLKKSERYEILRIKNVMTGGEYIEMWGNLRRGGTFLIRTPMESIRESAILSNRLSGAIMVVMTLLGSVLIWMFSRRIANPIKELAELSKRMADLDFNAKYTSGGKNEIGVLGRNFNVMSEKLEGTIAELKRANYELQKDIEKKEKMEQMRTEFIGNISHELKTPIALIQGYAEGLKENITGNAAQREFYCDVIVDESMKMNRLVQNLLTLNQLEVGEETVTFERFNVVEMIRGVVESNAIVIEQKDVHVEICAEDTVYVWADEWKAEQVLSNYFSNALHHVSEAGTIRISVALLEEKGTARITVYNTGERIPEEDIDQVWNKFYKVDKARTREYGGNGIGLSIVKAIMESFQRDYGVKNEEEGVTFWYELDVR